MPRRFSTCALWKAARIVIGLVIAWVIYASLRTHSNQLDQKSYRSQVSREAVATTPPIEKNESLKVPPAYLEDITGISPHDYAYKLRPNYGGICQQNGFDSRSQNASKDEEDGTDAKKMGKPLLMVALVHSRANHFLHRKVIRETWASQGKKVSKVLFLLGNPHNASVQAEVEKENATFGDILQEDFYEAYRRNNEVAETCMRRFMRQTEPKSRPLCPTMHWFLKIKKLCDSLESDINLLLFIFYGNITLKAVMGLKWVAEHCPRVPYVTKCDDDMYVSVRRILGDIINRNIPRHKLLLCSPVKNAPVERVGKYAVPKSLYANKSWPDFCFGGCWVASTDVIKKLYEKSLVTRHIYLDDVFVTGILRIKNNFKISRISASSRLFCHGRGIPDRVRMFYKQGLAHLRLSTGKNDKWNHCFH